MTGLRILRRSVCCALTIAASLAAVPWVSAEDFFEIVDVPLVEVEVAVIGADGRPVSDLPQDAFQLLVDGQEQEISFFAAPDLAELDDVEQTDPRPAHLVILFDNNSIEAQNRNAVIEDYREFLEGLTAPVPQIMVATASRAGLEIEQPFTSDLELIDDALDRVATTAARDRHVTEYESILMDIQRLAGARDPTKRDSTSQAATLVSRIIAFSDRARQDGLQTAAYIWQLTEALAGLPGQKSVLYIGGAVSVSPGEALLTALKSMLERSADEWAQKAGAELPAGVASGGSSEIDALSQIASVRGVTVYSFVAGGAAQSLSTGSSASSLTAKDSSTMDGSGSWSPGFDSRTRGESRSALDSLAAATGGFVHARTGGATPVFERLHDQMAARYVLGFHPATGADGQTHEIDVQVEASNRAVRHRQTFQARSWDEETAAQLRSALLFGGEQNLHGISVEARRAESRQESELRIPLTIRFPLTSLSIEPIGDQHRGQASVFATASGQGRLETVPIRKSVLPVVLPNEDLSGAVGQMAEYRLDLAVPAESRSLAVAVRDDLSTELSVVRLEMPGSQTVLLEPNTPPQLDQLTSDQAAPVRLPSAALLMSGQQGGNLQLEVGAPEADASGREPGITIQGWVDGDQLAPTSLDLEAHAYLVNDQGSPLSRSSRRLRMDLSGKGAGLTLLVEPKAKGTSIRLLVRDLRTHDFGLVAVPVPNWVAVGSTDGAETMRLELTMASRDTEALGASQGEPGVPRTAVPRGRVHVSLEKVSNGLLEVLELAADEDRVAAQNRLRDLEIEITSGRSPIAVIELGKQEARVLESMANDSWERLLPLALIWGELINDYHRRLMGPLSEHAIAMSTQLATIMARKAATSETRAEASDLLLSLSGYLLYQQRLAKTEQLLELAVKVDPNNARAGVGLAATREQQGNFQDAVFALRRVPESSPAANEGRLRLAVNLERLGHSKEAETLLDRLVDSADGWVAKVAVQEMVRLLVRTGRSEEAVPLLQRSIETWPNEQALQVQLAWLLDLGHRSSEAGDLATEIARTSTSSTGSPRFRYHRWYAEGLTEVRDGLAKRSSVRAAEAFRGLVEGSDAAGGS